MTTSSEFSVAVTHLFKGMPQLTAFRKSTLKARPLVLLEMEQRLHLIEGLHRVHIRQKKNGLASARDSDILPPDAWLNEQLMQLGQTWRVQTVDGFRYEFYEASSSR